MATCLAIGLGAAVSTSAEMQWSDAQPLNINAATDGAVGDYYPQLAGDGNGNWVCVWCAAVPAAPDRDFDILVTRSADNGATWTSPELLDPFAAGPPEIEDDFHPYVYTDGVGHWITTWYTHDNHGGTIGDDVDILVSRSVDNGVTWTSSVPLNTDAATDHVTYDSAYDSEPDLAYDGAGHWVALWTKRLFQVDDSDLYVAHSTDHGQTWSDPALLHASMTSDTGDDWGARIASDQNGHWVIVWSSEDLLGGTIGADDDILVSRSTDGYTWTAPASLNSDAASDGDLEDKSPQIVLGQGGRWVAVWYRGIYSVVDDDILVSRSDDNGVTWTPVEYLNDNAETDPERDRMPTVATDRQGTWVAVWYSRNTLGLPIGADDDVLFARSCDNAVTWSSPGVVNSYASDLFDMAYDWNPVVAYAGGGRWLSVWYSKYNLGGTIGDDWDLMLATSYAPLPDGDQDCDEDVDLHDARQFQVCYGAAAPLPDACGRADIDDSGSVDFDDFVALSAAYSGPGGSP